MTDVTATLIATWEDATETVMVTDSLIRAHYEQHVRDADTTDAEFMSYACMAFVERVSNERAVDQMHEYFMLLGTARFRARQAVVAIAALCDAGLCSRYAQERMPTVLRREVKLRRKGTISN